MSSKTTKPAILAILVAASLAMAAPTASANHADPCNLEVDEAVDFARCVAETPSNIREDIMQDVCGGTSGYHCLEAIRAWGSVATDLAVVAMRLACPPAGSVSDCQERVPDVPPVPPVPPVEQPEIPGSCPVDSPGTGATTPPIPAMEGTIVVPLPPVTVVVPGFTFAAFGQEIHQDRREETFDPTDPEIPYQTPGVPGIPVHTGPVKVCVDI